MWDYIFYLLLIIADGTFISKIHTIVFLKRFPKQCKEMGFSWFCGQEQVVPPESILKIGLFNSQRHETIVPHRSGISTVSFTGARSLYSYIIHFCLFKKRLSSNICGGFFIVFVNCF